jgi:hypothetical protein
MGWGKRAMVDAPIRDASSVRSDGAKTGARSAEDREALLVEGAMVTVAEQDAIVLRR